MKDFLVAYLDEFHFEADIQLCKITEQVTWLKRVGREVGAVQDGGVTYIHIWPIHTNVWQKKSQYCKVIILQLK